MLCLTHLCKSYGKIVAVDDLSLELRSGEVFGLLGPNGAGKTTTVAMAMGLLKPDSGSVRIGDVGSPDAASVRAMIGVAPQALALYDDLTGTENLQLFGRLQGMSRESLRKRVAWSLAFAGLTERASDRVKTYSGGMKRRLNLAAAIVHDPPVLLLDEPTVGVDPQSRHAIFKGIEKLRDDGRTIVYTTHYIEEAQRLCDRVGILDHGRLLALGTVDKLIADYGGKSVVSAETADGAIRIETDEPMAEIARVQQKRDVRSIRMDRPDLERVFLNLTGRHLRD